MAGLDKTLSQFFLHQMSFFASHLAFRSWHYLQHIHHESETIKKKAQLDEYVRTRWKTTTLSHKLLNQ